MKQDDDAFDLVIVDDGLGQESLAELKNKFHCHLLEPSGNIAENRLAGFRFMIDAGYQYTVFADADDLMSADRVRVTTKLLENYDIVANDLDIMSSDGQFIKKAIWSDRLQNLSEITPEDIFDSNIIGLGNSGVRTAILTGLEIPSYIIAVDWFIYTVLLNRGYRAIFTSRTSTGYRQHDANILGIGDSEISDSELKKKIKIKSAHYRALRNLSPRYARKYAYYSTLESQINNPEELNRHMADRAMLEKDNSFWLETV